MAQDIIGLGLDVSGFSPEKKRILDEFVATFDRLEKYDGKVFNPILGGGLVEFNNAIKQTSVLLDEINVKLALFQTNATSTATAATTATKATTTATNQQAAATTNVTKAQSAQIQTNRQIIDQYRQLVELQKQQFTTYSNLYIAQGRNSEQTKAALADYADTTKRINEIDKSAQRASGGVAVLGRTLGSGLNQLRQLAYIIPGIGLAGIFNLAFEAIGKVVEELGLFSKEIEKASKSEVELNGLLKTQADLFNTLLASVKAVRDANQFGIVALGENTLEAAKAAGLGKDLALPIERTNIENKFKQAELDMKAAFQSEQNINAELDKREKLLGETMKKLHDLNAQEAEINRIRERQRTEKGSLLTISKEEADKRIAEGKYLASLPKADERKARRDALESEVGIEQEKIKLLSGIAKDYFSLRQELNVKDKEIFKFTADEENAIEKEKYENRIRLAIQANEKILHAEISSRDDKLNALNTIANREKELARREAETIKNTLGVTTAQKVIAEENAAAKIKAIDIKLGIDRHKIIEDYRIALLSAIEGINKDALEKEAIANERVFQNDKKTLDERLKAFTAYITQKQKQQDLETRLQLEAERLKAKGEVPEEQRKKIQADANLQKANIQANAEKQVYDIVSTSLQRQLKAVLDENALEETSNKTAYANALNQLTDLYEKKQIKFGEYRKKIKSIEKQYNVEGFDREIEADVRNIDRLQKQVDKEKELKKVHDERVDSAFVNLDYTKSSGGDTLAAQMVYDEAVGEQNAINDAIIESEKKLQDAKDELQSDQLKRAKARIDELGRYEKEAYQNNLKIIEAIFNLIQKVVDQEYENRIANLKKQQETVDETYGTEIAAIDKSTLSAKDKAALDIQLNAQKMQSDKNADAQERTLKRQQAIADREITVAKITWETEEAVMAARVLLPPFDAILAAQRAILGAIAIATVLATPIPSFAKGVKDFKGGMARYGEEGAEIIKKPYQSPYLVNKETISYLPKGTDVIPVKDTPELGGSVMSDGWEQTKWLGRQIRKSKQEIKNVFRPTINIDMGFENYKRSQLYGR